MVALGSRAFKTLGHFKPPTNGPKQMGECATNAESLDKNGGELVNHFTSPTSPKESVEKRKQNRSAAPTKIARLRVCDTGEEGPNQTKPGEKGEGVNSVPDKDDVLYRPVFDNLTSFDDCNEEIAHRQIACHNHDDDMNADGRKGMYERPPTTCIGLASSCNKLKAKEILRLDEKGYPAKQILKQKDAEFLQHHSFENIGTEPIRACSNCKNCPVCKASTQRKTLQESIEEQLVSDSLEYLPEKKQFRHSYIYKPEVNLLKTNESRVTRMMESLEKRLMAKKDNSLEHFNEAMKKLIYAKVYRKVTDVKME